MADYVYVANKGYADIFVNPIYIPYSVGVADSEEEARKIAAKFFNIHENYHISTDYKIEVLNSDKNIVIGWKVSPIDS